MGRGLGGMRGLVLLQGFGGVQGLGRISVALSPLRAIFRFPQPSSPSEEQLLSADQPSLPQLTSNGFPTPANGSKIGTGACL